MIPNLEQIRKLGFLSSEANCGAAAGHTFHPDLTSDLKEQFQRNQSLHWTAKSWRNKKDTGKIHLKNKGPFKETHKRHSTVSFTVSEVWKIQQQKSLEIKLREKKFSSNLGNMNKMCITKS